MLHSGPAAVLVTDGPAPVLAMTAAGERPVPVPTAEVVDSVGAGDAFVAALLAWWTARALNREQATELDSLAEAATAAVDVGAAACSVRGANLPDGFSLPTGIPNAWTTTGSN